MKRVNVVGNASLSMWLCDTAAMYPGCNTGKVRLGSRTSDEKQWHDNSLKVKRTSTCHDSRVQPPIENMRPAEYGSNCKRSSLLISLRLSVDDHQVLPSG